jgi:hypothetical protein
MPEKSEQDLARLIAIHTVDIGKVEPGGWSIPSNYLASFLADLSALDLVQPSGTRHSVNDRNTYWSLSAEGMEVYKAVRLERLRQGKTAIDEEPKGGTLEGEGKSDSTSSG